MRKPSQKLLVHAEQAERWADWVDQATLTPATPLDMMLLETVERAARTTRAVATLGRAGFSEQAFMLARAVFEDTVVVYWAATHPDPDEVLSLIGKHHAASEAVIRHDILEDASVPVSDDERSRSSRHWTQKPLHKLVGDIEERVAGFPFGEVAAALRTMLRHVRMNQLHLHHTMIGMKPWPIHRRLQGVDDQLAEGAVQQVAILLELLLFPVVWRNALERIGEFDALRMDDAALTRIADIGRNDLCWCGSGRKFKRCHGA